MSWDQLHAFAQSTPLLTALFVVLSLAVIVSEVRRLTSGVRSITPVTATQRMNREDALVVDVSPMADFAKAHILGSVSVPLSELRPDTHKVLSKARERPVIVVCRAGSNARGAAVTLRKAGFKDVNVLEGGIAGWRQADLPLTKGR